MEKHDLRDLLRFIPPSTLDYQDWCNVGMALKHEGYTAADWDSWSRQDPDRYHAGECFKKWDSFQGTGTPVTGGTIVQLAKDCWMDSRTLRRLRNWPRAGLGRCDRRQERTGSR